MKERMAISYSKTDFDEIARLYTARCFSYSAFVTECDECLKMRSAFCCGIALSLPVYAMLLFQTTSKLSVVCDRGAFKESVALLESTVPNGNMHGKNYSCTRHISSQVASKKAHPRQPFCEHSLGSLQIFLVRANHDGGGDHATHIDSFRPCKCNSSMICFDRREPRDFQ